MAIDTAKIWEEFRKPLQKFITRRVKNEAEAEDILQNVFYKIHSKNVQLADETKLQAWLYKITRNEIINFFRSRQIVTEVLETSDTMIYEPVPVADPANEIALCLPSMTNYLPEKYRQAIILTEYKGLTQKKLAEKMGISLSGAKSRVQRARQRLKEMLLDCCYFEFDRRGKIIDFLPKGNNCRYCSTDPARK